MGDIPDASQNGVNINIWRCTGCFSAPSRNNEFVTIALPNNFRNLPANLAEAAKQNLIRQAGMLSPVVIITAITGDVVGGAEMGRSSSVLRCVFREEMQEGTRPVSLAEFFHGA